MKNITLPADAGLFIKSQSRYMILGLIGVFWLVLVASFYYVSHKPFSPTLAGSLGRTLGQSAAAFALVSVGGGVGFKALSNLQMRPLAALALQAAFGLGLLSLGVLVVGSLVGVSSLLAWVSLVILGFLFRRSMLSWWRSWADFRLLWMESDGLGRSLGAGFFLLLLFTWIISAALPLKFDALVYHLALPRLYLEAGRVAYVPGNMFWGMPQLGEMLYTWVFTLAGVESAVILGWLAGLLAIVGLLGFLSQRLGTRPAWVAIAALLSGYSLSASLAWGYVDWWAILCGVGFLAALSNFDRGVEGLNSLPLAGLFAGLALGTKYSAGILLVAGWAYIIWRYLKSRKFPITAGLVKFSLPVLLVSLPWWLKNALATGNPFYPFFFPSGAMNSFRQAFYAIPVWGSWQEAIFLPWRATMQGVEGGVGYSASLGPLLLSLVPLAWIGWKDHAEEDQSLVKLASIVSLVCLIGWAVAGRLSGYLIQARLYWAFFPSLAVLAGAGFKMLDGLAIPGLRLGRVAGALIIVLFSFTVVQMGETAIKMDAVKTLLAIKGREDYLGENLGWYAPAVRAVRELPAGSRTLLLWEPRSLYCAPDCQPDEVLDRWRDDLRGRSPQKLLKTWRDAGFTNLLLNRLGADYIRQNDPRYSLSEWQALEKLLATLPEPQDFGGAYQLYTLSP